MHNPLSISYVFLPTFEGDISDIYVWLEWGEITYFISEMTPNRQQKQNYISFSYFYPHYDLALTKQTLPSEKEIFRSHLGNTQFYFIVTLEKNILFECFELIFPLHSQWTCKLCLRVTGAACGSRGNLGRNTRWCDPVSLLWKEVAKSINIGRKLCSIWSWSHGLFPDHYI